MSKTMSTDIRQREKSEDDSDTWEGVLKVINAISSFFDLRTVSFDVPAQVSKRLATFSCVLFLPLTGDPD